MVHCVVIYAKPLLITSFFCFHSELLVNEKRVLQFGHLSTILCCVRIVLVFCFICTAIDFQENLSILTTNESIVAVVCCGLKTRALMMDQCDPHDSEVRSVI